MNKRLIFIVLVGMMGFLLPSCGNGDVKENQANTETGNAIEAADSTAVVALDANKTEFVGENPLIGTWVEPAIEGSLLGDVGFSLLENGGMQSINTGYREYKSWECVGEKLVIRGEFNGSEPYEFADTLDVVSIDDKQLVLGQDGYTVFYQRK